MSLIKRKHILNLFDIANNSFASLSEASALARGVKGFSAHAVEDPSGLHRENFDYTIL